MGVSFIEICLSLRLFLSLSFSLFLILLSSFFAIFFLSSLLSYDALRSAMSRCSPRSFTPPPWLGSSAWQTVPHHRLVRSGAREIIKKKNEMKEGKGAQKDIVPAPFTLSRSLCLSLCLSFYFLLSRFRLLFFFSLFRSFSFFIDFFFVITVVNIYLPP